MKLKRYFRAEVCVLLLVLIMSSSLSVCAEASAQSADKEWHDLGNGIFATVDQLKRMKDKAVILRFTLENRGSGKKDIHPYVGYGHRAPSRLGAVQLVDLGTMSTWGCLKQNGNCIGSTSSEFFKALNYKQSRSFWAYMTPPGSEITEIGVKIGAGAPIHGVPIVE